MWCVNRDSTSERRTFSVEKPNSMSNTCVNNVCYLSFHSFCKAILNLNPSFCCCNELNWTSNLKRLSDQNRIGRKEYEWQQSRKQLFDSVTIAYVRTQFRYELAMQNRPLVKSSRIIFRHIGTGEKIEKKARLWHLNLKMTNINFCLLNEWTCAN